VFSFSGFVILAFLPSWGVIFFRFGFRRSQVDFFSSSFQTVDSDAFAIIIGLAAGNFSFFLVAG
jgi:hypothetical protein